MVAATEAAFALVWDLAMLLRNRFYGGEVVHRGQIHPGKQQPILDRELFNAVPDKLTAGTNARLLKLHAPPSILTAAFLTSWQPHDAGPHKQTRRTISILCIPYISAGTGERQGQDTHQHR